MTTSWPLSASVASSATSASRSVNDSSSAIGPYLNGFIMLIPYRIISIAIILLGLFLAAGGSRVIRLHAFQPPPPARGDRGRGPRPSRHRRLGRHAAADGRERPVSADRRPSGARDPRARHGGEHVRQLAGDVARAQGRRVLRVRV